MKVLIAVLLMPVRAVLCGYVITVLWAWFISPCFGIHQISIPYAMGLSLIVNFITYKDDLVKKEYKDDWISEYILSTITLPGITLLFGYIYKSFI